MKKLLFIFLFSITALFVFGDCNTANSYALQRVENGIHKAWTDWIPCNVIVCLDIDNGIVTIYSTKPQVYYIFDAELEEGSSDKDAIIILYCHDSNEKRCNLRYRVYYNQNKKHEQLYVLYNDAQWVYSFK